MGVRKRRVQVSTFLKKSGLSRSRGSIVCTEGWEVKMEETGREGGTKDGGKGSNASELEHEGWARDEIQIPGVAHRA
jgi:hypothetical protein